MMRNRRFKKNRIFPKWKLFAAIYIVLLIISFTIQHYYPVKIEPTFDQNTLLLPQKGSREANQSTVKIAYFDSHLGDDETPPVVLLIHGNPIAARTVFQGLIPSLSRFGRVIAPDLPGFGASTRKITDYSSRAQARYMLEFLDRLNIEKLHIVAYSLGGKVALNIAHIAPDRVQSVTMVSASGVQEFELLGSYYLNHALQSLQLALIWFLHNGLPHMGLLDKVPFNWSYARSFYDTDSRPLRKYLENYQLPMLIVHGHRDTLVTVTTAREHFRIVPQSELKLYDGGHLILFTHLRQIARDISHFIRRVDSGGAVFRKTAEPQRITQAQKPFRDIKFPPATGITLAILMLLIALATLISEDLACIGAGLMTARGTIGLIPAVFASFLGIFFGDILLYLAGRFFGRTALRYPPLKWIIEADDIARTSRWFTAKGPIIILTSRFLPGSRLPTYFSAGILGTSFWLFTLYFSVAAALWTPLLVGMAAVVGSQMLVYYEQVRHYSIGILLGTVFCLWLLVKLVIPLFSFRGRRLLLSSFRRKIHYEFWPTPVFYIPVVLYILYLSMRHRSLTMFTASNPGIPAGGLVGESKSQILDSFQTEREVIARYRLIDYRLSLTEKVSQAVHFMSGIETSFPIVLKPDAGERGASVAIIKSKDELENYLAEVESDTIVQEYVEGYEYGVFYYRYPGQRKGHIFTITDKRRLTLIGDGRSNLETLILKDDRAVCKAPLHLKVHGKNLFKVPGKGEEVKLVEVGAHARGALFLDGNYAWTPALEAAIDKTSKGFKGFYFGRYDIRAPSIEEFMKGKNFKIVELNGVTSEATDIYDPKNSIWHAYNVLMKQWKIAFEIGALNVKQGQETVPFIKLLGLLFRS